MVCTSAAWSLHHPPKSRMTRCQSVHLVHLPYDPVVVPRSKTPSLEVQEFVAMHHHKVGNPLTREAFPETHDLHRHIVEPEFAKDRRRGVADVFAPALMRELGP